MAMTGLGVSLPLTQAESNGQELFPGMPQENRGIVPLGIDPFYRPAPRAGYGSPNTPQLEQAAQQPDRFSDQAYVSELETRIGIALLQGKALRVMPGKHHGIIDAYLGNTGRFSLAEMAWAEERFATNSGAYEQWIARAERALPREEYTKDLMIDAFGKHPQPIAEKPREVISRHGNHFAEPMTDAIAWARK